MTSTSDVPESLQQITEAEARFEELRKKSGYILAPALFLLILLIPFPSLTPQAHRLGAILGGVIILWMTESLPLPVTALLGPALAVLMGVAPVRQVFVPFADPIIFVFIGSFILAEAIFVHRLNERIAYGVLSWKFIGARPIRLLVAYGAITAFLSMWISNTATAAMILPLGLSLLKFMESEGGMSKTFGTIFVLMTAYGANYGGVGTPIGTPPNLITMGMIQRYAGIQISFVQWMFLGVPIALAIMTVVFLYSMKVGKTSVKEIPGAGRLITERKAALGGWKRGEKNVMFAFCVTVILWIGPGLLPLFLGATHPITTTVATLIPESIAALVGAILLFVIPLNAGQRSTLTWRQASNIDWGTILIFGGGLALGQLAFDTKLAEGFGQGIVGLLPVTSLVSLTFAASFFAVVVSEAMSNTAAANIAIPVVISIAQAAGIDPLIPALSAGLAASMGVLLPVSTPPCAIVYGSGYVPITKMIRYGFILDVISIFLVPIMVLLLVPMIF